MKSLGEVLALSVKYLKEKMNAKPRYVAENILAHVLKIDRMQLYVKFDCPLEESELERIREFLKRAATNEPLEYILGSVDFYGCCLRITPDVLIPRQETEILVDKAVQIIEKEDRQKKVAWDVCTGSGCIGLALKKKFPELQVSLSDLSEKALSLAKNNAEAHQLDVTCLQGDLLEPFKGKRSDFIFCNPPYISKNEYESLHPSVRDFEPNIALVGGITGAEFYEKLAHELPGVLNPRGRVFLEIGSTQGEKVCQIFSSACWVKKELIKDWAGHNRFFFLEIE
jgi:release factor glutamine methyltransferase